MRGSKSLILYAIWMTAFAVVVLWAAYQARRVLLLLYISGLLAVGFSPIVRLIERQSVLPIGSRRFPRWLAILLLYLVIIGAVVGVGFVIVPPLVEQGRELAAELPEMFDRAQAFLVSQGLLDHPLSVREAFQRAPVRDSADAFGTVFGTIVGFVGGIFGFVTILIVTFYLLVEADELRRALLRLFPADRRARASVASGHITEKVSAWLGGQLLLASIIGVTSWIALWVMGVPFYYVLALIAGIGELIPVVGPILAAIPAIAVAATVSWKTALLVLVFFIVQQQVENHLLVPKIMSRQVGVSAVTVIVALLLGGNLLGIVGAILAVPTAAIVQVVFNELTATDEPA
ncbi:MAG TPA: AI-2E family transporter [Vicinamibacterales bacterium]|nr:AI-2E family transporter [Vicinamibacterales bacterium]